MLASNTIDRLYKGLDAIGKLMNEAVAGEAAGIKVSDILALLDGEDNKKSDGKPSMTDLTSKILTQEAKIEKPEVVDELKVQTQPSEIEEKSKLQNPKSKIEAQISQPTFKIETIRVDTGRLDALMTQVGELSVTKARVARRISEIIEIIEIWERLNKGILDFGFWTLDLKSKIQIPKSKIESAVQPELNILGILLSKLKNAADEDYSKFDYVAGELEGGIRTIRLLPLSTIFNLYPRMVRDLAREQSKEVQLVIEGGEITVDKRILEEMKDPLMHLIRNAVDHGIEMPEERTRKGKHRVGIIKLKACQTAANIEVEVEDDGRGLDIEAIKQTALKRRICSETELLSMSLAQIQSLIFLPGFSTSSFITDVSGRGVGLNVVRSNIENLKGAVHIESFQGKGCRFRARLPVTLATTRILLAAINGRNYAIPVEFVQTIRTVSQEEIFPIEGQKTIICEGQPVSVLPLSELLELRNVNQKSKIGESAGTFSCVILSIGEDRLGLLVDAVTDEQEVVLKPQSAILKRVRNVSGATTLCTGEVCTVLNPLDLMKSAQKGKIELSPKETAPQALKKQAILLAEDSITTRTQMKRILEGAGYEVVAAVDGLDAFNKLSARPFDGVVSDILMPNMDGLALTEKIRQDKKYKEMPIILVTSLSSEDDKRRGIEVGANAYITKPAFDQKVFLDTLKRLI